LNIPQQPAQDTLTATGPWVITETTLGSDVHIDVDRRLRCRPTCCTACQLHAAGIILIRLIHVSSYANVGIINDIMCSIVPVFS